MINLNSIADTLPVDIRKFVAMHQPEHDHRQTILNVIKVLEERGYAFEYKNGVPIELKQIKIQLNV